LEEKTDLNYGTKNHPHTRTRLPAGPPTGGGPVKKGGRTKGNATYFSGSKCEKRGWGGNKRKQWGVRFLRMRGGKKKLVRFQNEGEGAGG